MTSVRLERLSIAMEEARLNSWLVADGDLVTEGQAIAEVESDKATVEIEAPTAGRIRLLVEAGAMVAVESELARLEDADGPSGPDAPSAARVAVGAPAHDAEGLAPPTGGIAALAADGTLPATDGTRLLEEAETPRIAASPSARRRAQAHGVDLARLVGTGPRGRIVVRDIQAAIAASEAPPVGTPQSPEPEKASRKAEPATPAALGRAPVGNLREAVVASLTASWRQIPHIHIGGQLEAAGLEIARIQAKARPGARVSTTDLVIVAVVQALRDVPALNGTVSADGAPRLSEEIHLAFAVATDRGVVAPVIRRVSELGIEGVSRERERLVAAAREYRLDGRDLAGATCTLSNLGGLPVDFFAPVVAGPQIALIAVGRIQELAVVRDGFLGVGHRMWVNAAIDHRGADGEAGGRFLQALEHRLTTLTAAL